MTITEAAACGTPSVATRIPGHLDAVIDQETGLLVESDTEMTNAVTSILLDDNKRSQMEISAVEHAKKFHWDYTAAIILNALCDDAESR